ncbi:MULTISPECIES: SDR family NAD(P)-dependent oxidoreductase [Actinoalloteichus]|uniref:3-oxoacyl-[acyl-carrier protein] reductase n=1 Tax=Actinoalloteichus caeruleus DSM 43889 TaxID=1120930 RepID=A0ABT1JE01_ACTCY|nr:MULTISPECIES: SDR family oxidoreductase [Actinoalloteichus]MCP2330434.1 3-oxoacyl-[acyl-carrier protein] reductase [Actinoalloteichus caeruleus DSM 43889]
MDLGLDRRVALVTGASGAIGHATARTLAREGALVAATWYQAETEARALVETIEQEGGTALAVHLDLTDPASITRAARRIRRDLGAVTVLVANAVSWPPREADTAGALAASFAANTTGTVALVDEALPDMRAAGWGRIVVISTDLVDQPLPGPVAYPAAKAALEGVARVMAAREARHGILTNVVRPGFTLTDRVRSLPDHGQAVIDAEAGRTPTGRLSYPEDIAATVVYLGSAANGHVNGEVVSVSGGRGLTR